MLMPLDLPAGLWRRGTDLEAAGRWRDGSFIRWRDGIMQPTGGWRARTVDTITGAPRGSISWQDNGGDRWVATGTATGLFVISASGTVSDITPVGYVSGLANAAVNTGFGGGFFGAGFFGNTRADNGNYSEAATWALTTWGENLVACTPSDGKIYEWDLTPANPATVIANAPVDCLSVHSTSERFLFALGSDGNPRKVSWSDREDNNTWTAAAVNEAGSFELNTSGQIMGAVSTRGEMVIVTDTDAHVVNYIGPPFVHSFSRAGSSCGAMSRKCIVAFEGGAMWMGTNGFHAYNGGDAVRVECDVSDFVFGDFNSAQKSLVHGVANAQFGEIWWFFPSGSSNECDKYVVYDYRDKHWSFGKINRTSGVDSGVFQNPIWFSSDGSIYDHEVGTNYDDERVWAESGPISIGNGDQVMTVTNLIPDEQSQGDCEAYFKTRFYPNAAESSFGPYALDAPTDVRFTGRQVRIGIDAAKNVSWRWGIPRIEVVARGKR